MRGRTIFLALVAVTTPIACIDLFHSTDFVTLCQADPSNTLCGGDGGDGAAPIGDAGPEAAPIDFCAWSPSEARDAATRACAWLGACEGPLDDSVFGPCMLHALWAYDCTLNPVMRPRGATLSTWECLARVKTCDDVARCVFPHGATRCPPVSSGSFTACEADDGGTISVECALPQEGPPVGVDPCVLSGRGCVRADLSTSFCTGGARTGCSPGRRCEGTYAVDCFAKNGFYVDQGLDCAAFGIGSCHAGGGDAGGACEPGANAPSCTETEAGIAVECRDGGIATSCVAGKEISVACGAIGLACDVTTNPAPPYDPLKACTPVRADAGDAGPCLAADECSGGTLRSCAQGAAFEVDCASVGLGACARVGSSAVARCTPP